MQSFRADAILCINHRTSLLVYLGTVLALCCWTMSLFSPLSKKSFLSGCTPWPLPGHPVCTPGRVLSLSCLPTADVLHQISHREHGRDGAGLQDEAGGAAAALQGEATGAGEAAAPQGLRVSHRLLTQVLVFSSWALSWPLSPGEQTALHPSLPPLSSPPGTSHQSFAQHTPRLCDTTTW